MKTSLFSFFFILICFSISAQSTITGKVVDQDKSSIFFATVALYNSVDSNLVNAVSTFADGSYEIKNVTNGLYYIEATMLGFKAQKIEGINIQKSFTKEIRI